MLEPKTSSAGIIEMQNVGIRYGQGPEILSDIKLSLKKGSFHFLTGKSGAGKTSLLSMMYLAQKPSRGTVNVLEPTLTSPTVTTLPCCGGKSASFFRTSACWTICPPLTT
ncbi:MAG: ATP-binding cassette domain-containing protein [Alphaproteobacteria bacterium]